VSERLTKRQLKHDRFLEIVQEVLAYARTHAFVVVAVLAVFVAGVALAVRVAGQATGPRPQNPEAERALAAARTEFTLGRMDAGRAALEEVRTRHRNSRAGREATYILANAYFESGDWAQAAANFEQFLRKPLHDDLLHDGARQGLAACKEEAGDLSGALDAYRALWKDARHLATRLDAALSAARCARALGRPDEARTLYQAVLDAYPAAPAAAEARFALASL
jgi:TolA-binding protein